MRQKILEASGHVLGQLGLGGWTVDKVASQAGCAKGLVIYHFGSKRQLLSDTAAVLGRTHSDGRSQAVAGKRDTEALDELWDSLVREVGTGQFAGWVAIQSDPALRNAARLPEQMVKMESQVADSLGLVSDFLGPAGTLSVMLDGIQLQLLLRRPAEVRAIYDRLWLAVLAG